MTTPSRVININRMGFARMTVALRDEIASKRFVLENNGLQQALVRQELATGVAGLKRRKLLVRAQGEHPMPQPTVYIGDSNVDENDGYPLYLLDEIELDVDDSTGIFAAALLDPGQTADVSILEIE